MSKKPQKRLVSTHKYLGTLLGKGGLYSSAMACAVGSGVLLIVSLFLLWLGLPPWGNAPEDLDRIWMFLCGGFFGVLFVGAIWFGVSLFTAATRMERVARITRHNTGMLPEVETLVRGSASPITDQQAVLLRAAGCGRETPPEQLLRATQEIRKDA